MEGNSRPKEVNIGSSAEIFKLALFCKLERTSSFHKELNVWI